MGETRTLLSHEIPPKAAFAWSMNRGDVLRVTDVEGKQVGDLVLFDRHNPSDKLSISWTRTRNIRDTAAWAPSFGVTVGDRIISTGYRVLAVVAEDTPEPKGIHDLNGRMCNRGMYELYGVEPQPGCFELLAGVVAPTESRQRRSRTRSASSCTPCRTKNRGDGASVSRSVALEIASRCRLRWICSRR